jgi:hypothetical protein
MGMGSSTAGVARAFAQFENLPEGRGADRNEQRAIERQPARRGADGHVAIGDRHVRVFTRRPTETQAINAGLD